MKSKKFYIAPIVLLIFTIINIWLTADYGFSIDEAAQRDHGLIATHHVTDKIGIELECIKGQKDVDFQTYNQRYYGVIFQITAIAIECAFQLESWRSIYLLRHYLVFIIFCFSSLLFYLLIKKLTDDHWISILCLLIYFTHPRIFAHAHYNPKDINLLSVYAISMYSLYNVYLSKKTKCLIIHALMTALVINIRIVGIIIIPLTLFLLVFQEKGGLKRKSINCLKYLLSTSVITIAFWPLLWNKPLTNFIWAFKNMSNFPWLKDLIFWGESIPSVDVSWTYLFSWIGITTPIGILFLFLAAILLVAYITLKAPRENIYPLVIFGMTLGPIFAVLAFDSILYGDWRHLYFIYPGLIVISALFLAKMKKISSIYFKCIAILLLIQGGLSTGWIALNHPFQFNYFNAIGQNEIGKHEQDYWGLSYKNAMELLVEKHLDENENVTVSSPDFSAYGAYQMLEHKYRKQLDFSWSLDDGDYFVSNYRTMKDIDTYKNKEAPYLNELFQIKVDGVPICGVYKLK